MGILFDKGFKFGTSGKLYQNLSDPGSMLFGGAGVSNSLGQKRDGTKGGLFGDKAQGIDWMGSPVTAGTNSQGTARLAAILYGAWMGAGALGGGSMGAGGTTSASAAPTASGGGGWGATQVGEAGGGGLGGLGGQSGGMNPAQALNWGRRGYGAYNMLRGLDGANRPAGGGMQGGGGYGGGMQTQRPQQYGNPGQKPVPGSGPFDWLKF